MVEDRVRSRLERGEKRIFSTGNVVAGDRYRLPPHEPNLLYFLRSSAAEPLVHPSPHLLAQLLQLADHPLPLGLLAEEEGVRLWSCRSNT